MFYDEEEGKLQKKNAKFEELKNEERELKRTIADRDKKWKEIQETTARNVRKIFAKLMSLTGTEAKIVFDHEKETLHFHHRFLRKFPEVDQRDR